MQRDVVCSSHAPSCFQVRYLFDIMDEDGNGRLDLLEFFSVSDVLLLRVHR